MRFSHKQAAINAIATEVRRNKTMAINNNNTTFAIMHPDWIREAQNKNFIQLEKTTKEYMQKSQKLARDRRTKLHG